MHAMTNIALRAARVASEVIVQGYERLDRIKVYQKGEGDFVTDIDHNVEQILVHHIQKAYPEHSFLCEESGFIEGEDKDTIWVIDPLDGTRNFMRGLPHFCISIACLQNGKLQHGVIVDPIRRDEFVASRGQGAQLNDTRIRVGSAPNLQSCLVSLSCAGGSHHDEFLRLQHRLQGKIAGLRFTGSSALDLAYAACGRLDAGWMSGMQKWDIAAGIVLLQEAGAFISAPDGNPDCYNSSALVFSNPKCFKPFLKLIKASS